jgi:hypothetical protein
MRISKKVALSVFIGAWLVFLITIALHREDRVFAGDASSVGCLRSFDSMLVSFKGSCGGYPINLKQLGAPEAGLAKDCLHSAALEDLTDYEKSRIIEQIKVGDSFEFGGYEFRYLPKNLNTFSKPPRSSGFEMSGDPRIRDKSGHYSYLLTEDGRIHRNKTSAATASDPVIASLRQ